MPHITTAMHQSIRRGVGDIVIESLLGKRTISSSVDSVKNTFSSWDNCMAKTYCKWPVIAAIIIVSLILLSIVTCISRCCCGYSCCCSCFSFLKCCDCCGDSCEGKRNKPVKNRDVPSPFGDGPSQSTNNLGYQAPAPMMGGALPAAGKPALPQYAQFEVGKNGFAVDPTPTPLSEDALPPMPSWDSAAKKHVLTEDEKDGVELGNLNPNTGQHVPLMAGGIPAGTHTPSPIDGRGHSPFGARPGPGAGGTGYTGLADDHYDQNQAAYNGNARGYADAPNGLGGPRMGTPQMGGNQGMGDYRGYGANSPQEYNGQALGYGSRSLQDNYSQHDGFAPSPIIGGNRGYGRPPPQRQFSNDPYSENDQYSNHAPSGQRPLQYSANPQQSLNSPRSYTHSPSSGYPRDNFQANNGPPPRGPSRGPGGPNRMASPPLHNNSGFDFGGDQQSYRASPPPQQYGSQPPPLVQEMSYGGSNRTVPGRREDEGYFAGAAPLPNLAATRSPPPQESQYPGYKPYQPSPGGRGREPQGWDPVQ